MTKADQSYRVLFGQRGQVKHSFGHDDTTYTGDFAVVTTAITAPEATSVTHYLHRDHLGLINAVTDASGNVIERYSFDASKRSLAPPRRASGAASTGCR
jgi:uncharacterized protein RhaS with RHS repeats